MSNYLTSDQIKEEVNDEEGMEDVVESIGVGVDEHENRKEAENEDITLPKRKRKSPLNPRRLEAITTVEDSADSGQTGGRRVCGGIDCKELCQSPNEGYCSKCLTNIQKFLSKSSSNDSQGMSAKSLDLFKCLSNDCTALCSDKATLMRHLKSAHKLILVRALPMTTSQTSTAPPTKPIEIIVTPDIEPVIHVPKNDGQHLKKSTLGTTIEDLADSGQTGRRRVCGEVNCKELCQSPDQGYCPECLANIKQILRKSSSNYSRGQTIAPETSAKLKRKSEETVEDSSDISKTGRRRVCNGINCMKLCQSPDEGYCPKCLTNIDEFFKKSVVTETSVTPVVTGKPMASVPGIGCLVKDCTALCLDKATLMKHLNTYHKLILVPAIPMTFGQTSTCPPTKSKKPIKPTDIEPVIHYLKDDGPQLKKSTLGQGCGLEKQTKEVILNLNHYFKMVYPNMKSTFRYKFIEAATKVSLTSIYKVLKEFKETGDVEQPKPNKGGPPLKYKCNETDRQILWDIICKMKDENRLKGYMSVFEEMKTCDQYNPTFKKTCLKTFREIFTRFGFRVSRDRIIDINPADSERERIACERSKESGNNRYVCDWPGCQKEFNNSQHLIIHLRTHTGIKPYVCRVPKCHYRCVNAGNFSKHLKGHKISFEDDSEELI